jgi:hypothetical protein
VAIVAEARAVSAAPREIVWDVLADGRSWHEWGAWSETVYDNEGDPPPDGVGTVRRFTRRPVTSVERVEIFEPPARFGYELLSGLPLRGYHAVVTLTDLADGGTEIHWRSEFETRWPASGWFWRRFIRKVISDVARAIAAEAAQRAAAPAATG